MPFDPTQLELLPEPYRGVLEMAEVEGLPACAICERLGLSETTIRLFLQEARRRLHAESHPGTMGQ
jgi:DNA-directed RNA polymerase specialized sigma24 family protein